MVAGVDGISNNYERYTDDITINMIWTRWVGRIDQVGAPGPGMAEKVRQVIGVWTNDDFLFMVVEEVHKTARGLFGS